MNHKKSNGDDCIVISDDENGEKSNKNTTRKPKEEGEEKMDTNDDAQDMPPVLESETVLPDKQKLSQNPTWSFIDTPEHLAALINCLNTRGFRECSLRSALIELRPLLEQSLRDCPTDMLSLPEDRGEEEARIQVSCWFVLACYTYHAFLVRCVHVCGSMSASPEQFIFSFAFIFNCSVKYLLYFLTLSLLL